MHRIPVVLCLIFCSLSLLRAQGTSTANATAIAPNGTASASIDNSSFDHYWKVTTTQDGYLRCQIVSSAGLDVDVTLYDVNGTTAFMSDMQSGQNSEVFGFLQPGTFFLRVKRWSGTTGSYTVTSAFLPSARIGDQEPNGTPASGTLLGPNATSTGHLCYAAAGQLDTLDYWKITTTQDGWLRLQIRSDSVDARGDQQFDLDVLLFDIDGATQVTSDQGSGPLSQMSAYLRPGTYYVRIQRWAGRAGTYEITSQLTLPSRANDTEGNDWFARASTLSLSAPGTGHIGYYSNGSTDFADYWKIVAPGTDSIYIHVTSDPSLDLDLTGYGPDTALSVTADGRSGTYSRIGFKPSAGATYYCKVTYWSGTAGSYSIVASPSAIPVSVQETVAESILPNAISLSQNYPNPFNGVSEFGFRISDMANVKLQVFDLLGREVATLVDERKAPGEYRIRFDAGTLASGTYLYRLNAGSLVETRKMVIQR